MLSKPVYHITKRCTNTENYLNFIKLIIQEMNPSSQKPYLLFDGHSAHISKKAKELVEMYFIPVRLPPHSPEFNSAEGVFSIGKHYMRRLLTARPPRH